MVVKQQPLYYGSDQILLGSDIWSEIMGVKQRPDLYIILYVCILVFQLYRGVVR